jgi:hypothetical protein
VIYKERGIKWKVINKRRNGNYLKGGGEVFFISNSSLEFVTGMVTETHGGLNLDNPCRMFK